jgi:hypothetical protein
MLERSPHHVKRKCPRGTLGIGHSHLDGRCAHSAGDDRVQAVEQVRGNILVYAVQCGPEQHWADAFPSVTFNGRDGSYRLNASRADSVRAGFGNQPRPANPVLPMDPIPHIRETP